MSLISSMKAKITAMAEKVNLSAAAVSGAVLAAATSAKADGIDVTAATAGITSAQTAVLEVIAGMITMMVAVWGVRKVLRLFGR